MQTLIQSAAKLLLFLSVAASLLLTATACETTTIEPTTSKVVKSLPKDTSADDGPPEKPVRPPGDGN